MVEDEPRVYEIRVLGCPSSKEALALQAPIKLLLCPDPDHAPPCEVPWSFTLAGGDDGASTALVLGVYTSRGRAAQVADRVRVLVGEARSVAVSEGDAGEWEELVEQYRFERGLGSGRYGRGQ
ncbi:hypothetical protein SAMN06272771_2950 [Streptomyces sp. Ag82_O1-12]|uniref:hypothetical protein n=1 Tax=unclassified Streptomyces TaxID=2593676 RepID=UPI000BC7EDA7|nr:MULTISPECIES: hypothetical protein [unclassified Streptomyces]SMQ16580.1 hypothetical protein SAMN06272771_2950 [Streptomyces sp. Ag82_O1-12]SOD45608.1 hypothetical protein SAMN06272727_2946 [Streptomyces sp. Ag82_G6-1]